RRTVLRDPARGASQSRSRRTEGCPRTWTGVARCCARARGATQTKQKGRRDVNRAAPAWDRLPARVVGRPPTGGQSTLTPWASAHPHRHEQLRVASLHEQCDVALRL